MSRSNMATATKGGWRAYRRKARDSELILELRAGMVGVLHLLFYDDSPVFGGHEVMTLLGVEALFAEPDTTLDFLVACSNIPLLGKLQTLATRLPGLRVHPMNECSSKLEGLRNRLFATRARPLAARMKKLEPDLVVAVQGNIEHSSLALLAAPLAGLKVASYIPVPHSNAEMGAKLGALRDLFAAHLFKTPDAFVTISNEMALLLRMRGATCPIEIVHNGVDTQRFQAKPQDACRSALGLPPDRTVIGMVGRLEFRQKQQHLLVEAVKSMPSLASACHLVFAGNGPDRERLQALVTGAGFKSNVTILPWCDPSELYPALDALVIPSRYEGLPLVMLEALSCGTPVLGSDRDGMKDVLPPAWRFRPDSSDGLAATLHSFIEEGCPRAPEELVTQVRDTMSLEAFSAAFRACLVKLARSRS